MHDQKCLIRPRKEKWREEAWEKKNAKNGKSSKTGQNSGKNSLVEELEKIKSILIVFAVERSLEWVKKFLFHINMPMIK